MYIYDVEDWAIHEVGKLWLGNIDGLEVVFRGAMEVTQEEVDKSDIVWYGFTRLYFFNIQANINKSVIAVHDPNEVFTTHQFWKHTSLPLSLNFKIWLDFLGRIRMRKQNIALIKKAKHVVVVSSEMQESLADIGIKTTIIETTTDFPIKNVCKKNSLSIVSVANPHIRKNFDLLKRIKRYCEKNSISFHFKGDKLYSRKNYIEFMDKHNVYLCTSFQEGGPLPAMDLMARGGVVLTTPVGQIQDMIENGKNGFVCKTYDEFIESIDYLNNNIDVIEKMSEESIKTMSGRHPLKIKETVKSYLKTIVRTKTNSL